MAGTGDDLVRLAMRGLGRRLVVAYLAIWVVQRVSGPLGDAEACYPAHRAGNGLALRRVAGDSGGIGRFDDLRVSESDGDPGPVSEVLVGSAGIAVRAPLNWLAARCLGDRAGSPWLDDRAGLPCRRRLRRLRCSREGLGVAGGGDRFQGLEGPVRDGGARLLARGLGEFAGAAAVPRAWCCRGGGEGLLPPHLLSPVRGALVGGRFVPPAGGMTESCLCLGRRSALA